MNTIFDLKELYQSSFGYTPASIAALPSDAPLADIATIAPLTQQRKTVQGQPLYGQSDLMGNEVFCPVSIFGKDENGKDKVFQFPYCVVAMHRSKSVVETEMTELNDTAKECISLRSTEITLKGFFMGQYERFPDRDIYDLNVLFMNAYPVRLWSAYTDLILHKEDQVLIAEFELPATTGVVGVRPFVMQMKTDTITSLYI